MDYSKREGIREGIKEGKKGRNKRGGKGKKI